MGIDRKILVPESTISYVYQSFHLLVSALSCIILVITGHINIISIGLKYWYRAIFQFFASVISNHINNINIMHKYWYISNLDAKPTILLVLQKSLHTFPMIKNRPSLLFTGVSTRVSNTTHV